MPETCENLQGVGFLFLLAAVKKKKTEKKNPSLWRFCRETPVLFKHHVPISNHSPHHLVQYVSVT